MAWRHEPSQADQRSPIWNRVQAPPAVRAAGAGKCQVSHILSLFLARPSTSNHTGQEGGSRNTKGFSLQDHVRGWEAHAAQPPFSRRWLFLGRPIYGVAGGDSASCRRKDQEHNSMIHQPFTEKSYHLMIPMGFPCGSRVKKPPAMQVWVQSLGWECPLEEGMATHSSIPA